MHADSSRKMMLRISYSALPTIYIKSTRMRSILLRVFSKEELHVISRGFIITCTESVSDNRKICENAFGVVYEGLSCTTSGRCALYLRAGSQHTGRSRDASDTSVTTRGGTAMEVSFQNIPDGSARTRSTTRGVSRRRGSHRPRRDTDSAAPGRTRSLYR